MATLASPQPATFGGDTRPQLSTRPRGASRSSSRVIFCHAWLLAALCTLGVAYRAFELSAEPLIYPACLILAVLSGWFFWSWSKHGGELLDPYTLFLVAAVLFNSGQAFLQILHANRRGFLDDVFPPETLLQTLFLTMVGLASLHLGALLGLCTGLAGRRGGQSQPNNARQGRATIIVGAAMVAVSLVPFLVVLRESFSAVMSYGYFVGLFRRESAMSFDATSSILGSLFAPGALFLLAGSAKHRPSRIFSAAVIVGYCAMNAFLGSRAPAIAAGAACLWLWHRGVKPVRKVTLVALGALLLILLPLVAVVREVSGEQRSAAVLLDAFRVVENPAVSVISEMGSSMSTVAYTVDLVPAVRGYDMGRSYLFAFLTILPNFFWEVHPTVGHGLLSTWLVWTVDPGRAAINGGLGFSFLAEAYLNFGWLGAPFALGLIGFLLGMLVRWTRDSHDLARLAMAASLLSFVLIFTRGESASIVRGIVWYSAVPFLAVRVLSRALPGSFRR